MTAAPLPPSPPRAGDSLVHIPALDGIRGLAILTIVVYHGLANAPRPLDLNAFDTAVNRVALAGWVGVDLFFVLSGFLITGILLDMHRDGRNLLAFYGRRVLRIVPLFYLFMLALLLVLPGLLDLREEGRILRENQGWYWSFLLNWKLSIDPLGNLGFFGNGHLWSLMVEEQFYLVWPLVLLLTPRRYVLAVLAAVILAAPSFRFLLYQGLLPEVYAPRGAYVLAPARMDTLGLGAVLAVVVREPSLWRQVLAWRWTAALVAGGVLAVLAVHYGDITVNDKWTQIAGYTAIGVMGSAIVATAIEFGERAGWLARGLLPFFGRYSYAIYLFHLQIMYELPGTGTRT